MDHRGPPRYTDEPRGGGYQVIADCGARVGKVGRADLADFMLDQLDDHSYARKVVVVGYWVRPTARLRRSNQERRRGGDDFESGTCL